MKKVATIEWRLIDNSPLPKEFETLNISNFAYGVVNNNWIFEVEKKGKKNPLFILKALPFKNSIFPNANVSRILFKDNSFEVIKFFAEKSLNQFVDGFCDKSKNFDPAALSWLSIAHGQSNHANPEHVDSLIRMAVSFEKKYPANYNWEKSKIDWESALAAHYNKHKHPNWDSI